MFLEGADDALSRRPAVGDWSPPRRVAARIVPAAFPNQEKGRRASGPGTHESGNRGLAETGEAAARLSRKPAPHGPKMSDRPPIATVLVVEDEPLVRLLFADILTEAGFQTIDAANADDALTILASRFDVEVMVTDVEMPPGLDGFALAREVARRWPEIEILISTGRRWPAAGDLPSGAVFLTKPVPEGVLVSLVRGPPSA
jgi:CheY-like chemotaxis protein